MNKDLALGCATLAIAGGYYAMAAAVPESLLADAVGPQRVPQIYAVLLAGVSLVLIARALVRASPEPKGRRQEGPALDVARWRPVAMLTIGVIYVFALPWLGYVLSLACLIAATASLQGAVRSRKLLAVTVCGALFFWLLFVALLGVPQPSGLLPWL